MFSAVAVLCVVDPIVKLITAFALIQLNLSEWVYVSIPLSVVLGYVLTMFIMHRVKPAKALEDAAQHTHAFPYKFFFVAILSGLSAKTFLSLEYLIELI